MTEHNDGRTFPPESDVSQPVRRRYQPKHLKKRGGQKPFRLGVSCLALLLAIALLPVSGSFSQFYGQSEANDFPALTAAAFGVEVNESSNYDLGGVYADDQYVFYAFDVINNSQVPVKCSIELNIAVRYTGEDNMQYVKFYFCEDGGTDSDAITDFGGEDLKTLKVLSYDSETDGSTFYLGTDGDHEKTFVLVADCSAAMHIGAGTASNHLYLSNYNPENKDEVHAITVTAEQATGEGE